MLRPNSFTSKRGIMPGVCSVAVMVFLALTGCSSKPVPPASDLKMSDAKLEKQLISGFYDLEEGKWRWTARKFAVVLQPPAGSERTGATLRLKLYIPEAQIQRLGPMTLNANVGEHLLAPEKFMKGGLLEYSQNISPALISANLLPVVFTFDKALPPSPSEGRELGAVVSEVALEQKK